MWQYNYTDDYIVHTGVKGMRWGFNKGKSNGKKKKMTERVDTTNMSSSEKMSMYVNEGFNNLSGDWKYEFNKEAEKEVYLDKDGLWKDSHGQSATTKKEMIDRASRLNYYNAVTNNENKGLPAKSYDKGTAPSKDDYKKWVKDNMGRSIAKKVLGTKKLVKEINKVTTFKETSKVHNPNIKNVKKKVNNPIEKRTNSKVKFKKKLSFTTKPEVV